MKYLKTINVIAIFLTLSIFIGSCSKERIQEDELNEYSSMNDYLDSKKQEEQVFVIDSAGDSPIIGKFGTKIWIGKDILQYPNGDSVTYPFTLKLVELYTPKDMIYYQIPTISQGTIMATEGEIRVRAYKNDDELILKPNATMPVEMKNDNPAKDLECFYGDNESNSASWINTPTTSFNTTAYGYKAQIEELGWINCGELDESSKNYTISFSSDTDVLDNVKIFIFFPETKSVMQVYKTVSGKVPDNSYVKIVAMAINSSKKLFSYTTTYNHVNSNKALKITLSETTDAALESYLDSL